MNRIFASPVARVGVLGGGQLGRMLACAAARLDVELIIVDPEPSCPAGNLAAQHIVAGLDDRAAIETLSQSCDVITLEIEHVGTEQLAFAEAAGTPVRPATRVVRVIQDKLLQRNALLAAGIPQPAFSPQFDATTQSLPVVYKQRRGGYDGRGVTIVRSMQELPQPDPTQSYFEACVPIAREVAVLVARSPSGQMRTYAPFDMVFDGELNLVREVAWPADLSATLSRRCRSIAQDAVKALGIEGIAAVELFVTPDDQVLVNEIAPRPHNSGHLTIEAAETDQFEQHLRAILDLPLGSTSPRCAAVMRNLVAAPSNGVSKTTRYRGVAATLGVDGVHLHLYGKKLAPTGRKMGHITALGSDVAEARARADQAQVEIAGGDDKWSE